MVDSIGIQSIAEKNHTRVYMIISGFNVDTVYVSNDVNGLLKTTDGGKTWSFEKMEKDYSIDDIYFINNENGFALGSIGENNVILKTTKDKNRGAP